MPKKKKEQVNSTVTVKFLFHNCTPQQAVDVAQNFKAEYGSDCVQIKEAVRFHGDSLPEWNYDPVIE